MMFFRILKPTIFVITLFHASQAFTVPLETTVNFTAGDIYISGPADGYSYARVFGNSGTRVTRICNKRTINYTLRSIVYENKSIWTGRTFRSSSSHEMIYLYESGVSGIALSNLGAISPNPTHALGPETQTVWTGSMDSASRAVYMTHQLYIYKDETRLTGTVTIPSQNMVRYLCKDENDVTQEIYNVVMTPIQIYGNVTGCTPKEVSQMIEMDKIPQATIENSSPTTYIGTKNVKFSLQCDSDVVLKYSVVDLSDQTNTSTVAKLTADSTATGVGFAVLNPANGIPRIFGSDGSAMNSPGVTQYLIGTAGSSSGQRNLMEHILGFSYVRDPSQPVKSGSAKAMIGITYSYQ